MQNLIINRWIRWVEKNHLPTRPLLRIILYFTVLSGINLFSFVLFYFGLKYSENQSDSISIIYFLFPAFSISTITILFYALKNKLLYKEKSVAVALESNRTKKKKEIQLLEAVIKGEEKERGRIAKDLHDGVAGMLAASKIYFTTIQSKNDFLNESKEFQHSLQLLDEAANEIRKTAHSLMPEVLFQYGLDEALGKLCQALGPAKIEYYSINSNRLHPNFELPVYRIVQELLLYMIRHAKARQIMVQLSQQRTILSITIENNGVGTNKPGDLNGYDTASIYDRVQLLNGIIEWENTLCSNNVYMEFDIEYWEGK